MCSIKMAARLNGRKNANLCTVDNNINTLVALSCVDTAIMAQTEVITFLFDDKKHSICLWFFYRFPFILCAINKIVSKHFMLK